MSTNGTQEISTLPAHREAIVEQAKRYQQAIEEDRDRLARENGELKQELAAARIQIEGLTSMMTIFESQAKTMEQSAQERILRAERDAEERIGKYRDERDVATDEMHRYKNFFESLQATMRMLEADQVPAVREKGGG